MRACELCPRTAGWRVRERAPGQQAGGGPWDLCTVCLGRCLVDGLELELAPAETPPGDT